MADSSEPPLNPAGGASRGGTAAQRLLSVDAFRGAAIVLMFLVSAKSPVAQLRHSEWWGFHVADLVYPGFLFILGLSLQLSLTSQAGRGVSASEIEHKVIMRVLRLFLLGLLLLSASYARPRFGLGTLQCIAIALLFAFSFARTSLAVQFAGAGAIYVLIIFLEGFIGMPGLPPAEHWSPGHTFSEYLDLLVLEKPKGVEGVLPTLGAVPTVLFGLAAGRFMQTDRVVQSLLLLGAALIAFGGLLSICGVPVAPQVFSPSFSAIASGIAVLTLLIFFILGDRLGFRRALQPFAVYGKNAIAVYVFVKMAQVLIFNLVSVPFGSEHVPLREWLGRAAAACCGPAAGNIAFPLTKVLIGGVFCLVLYRRKIFFKV